MRFFTGRINTLSTLSVSDAWLRRGVGILLLAELELRARSFGVPVLVGDVLRANAAMKALARKAGFGFIGLAEDLRLIRIRKEIVTASQAANSGGCYGTEFSIHT